MKKTPLITGWREWAALPELGVENIKVKVDTGAKTSSIHAFDIMPFTRDGKEWVQFEIHPLQDQDRLTRTCTSPIVDYRWITSSMGSSQLRYIIRTTLTIGRFSAQIDLSLANRDEMGFRMLVGRDALSGTILVDPNRSFLLTSDPTTKGKTA